MQIDEETFLSILKEHQLWVDSNGQSGKRADLSGQDFAGISFRYYAYLPSASPWTVNLRFAILREINFSHADLSEANLEAANLIEGNLNGANLNRAILSKAAMINAHLRGANLRGADLTATNLTGADLTGANLTGAELRGANLTRANLIGTDLTGADLNGANVYEASLDESLTDFLLPPQGCIQFIAPIHFSTDNWGKKFQSLEIITQGLQAKLNQAESKTEKDEKEIKKLKDQLERAIENLRKLKLKGRIKDAQKSLSEALKNTDKQINNNDRSAWLFKWLGIVLFSMGIFLIISFGSFVVCLPEFLVEKNLNILFYTFPIVALMLIGTTCLRHQKNLLREIRHFSNMKHQIELYSGLLEASQHAAASFNDSEKADEYVQETFTQIRNRLLNSQYLPDNSSADKHSDNDFGSDKVLDLLNKIADLSGKKSMGN